MMENDVTNVPIFFIEPTGSARFSLRRYARREDHPCPNGYHNAQTYLHDGPDEDRVIGDSHPHDDPRWPTKCEHCDYEFEDADNWQLFSRAIYRRHDDHESQFTLYDAPVGAVWNAYWMADSRDEGFFVGPDGRCLMVMLPDRHEWCIDSRARNCTMPDDNTHKCWVRHGKPEDGSLHVDKNGHTCAAGAGSIGTDNYHGFLHHGHLTAC